jgi:chitodextrinase
MRLLILLIPVVLSTGCGYAAAPVHAADVIPIPTQQDWTDYGVVLSAGALGEWDYQLFGGFTGTVVKRDGTFYLYYQGARGYRLIDDETVTWRAIGVATSPDGINFTKSDSNPVVVWFPTMEGEEGAASGGATLDESGEIVLYYGANTAETSTLVNADARMATSMDGHHFTDQGIVLDYQDRSLWGSGDEIFPIIAIQDAGRWFVYYIPNGTPQKGKLGVAWGNSRDVLTNSSGVFSGLSSITAWGMGASAKIGPDIYALFLNDVAKSRTEVRTVSLNTPNQLSEPVATYPLEGANQACILLDEQTRTWFMYYRAENGYGVKLAPAGEPDTTPPTAPKNVTATSISDRQVDLSWSPALDAETGIVLYRVFRDGVYLATVKGWHFSDTGLVEQTTYSYTVSAVNYHGVKGPQSAPASVTTAVDVTPPGVVSVNASGPSNQVTLVYDEPVEKASAEVPGNYTINQGIAVQAATLNPDLRTVLLTTSEHEHDKTYRITVNNVRDRARDPNPIAADTAIYYTYSAVPGLVGGWTFDEGTGESAFDTANYGNHGALIYRDVPGPAWVDGRSGYALYFDGIDDQVTIDGSGSLQDVTDQSYTFAAWVLADRKPPNASPNDRSYSVLVRNRTGLYYDYDGRFRAQIRLSDDTEMAVSSGLFAPGRWHHLAMVVDDANKSLRLYVNGQAVGDSSAEYTGLLADHGQAPYYIGTSEPLTERYEYRFTGKIDEVRIYDRALSPLEVRRLSALGSDSRIYLPLNINTYTYPYPYP